jgi:hypothetical protein
MPESRNCAISKIDENGSVFLRKRGLEQNIEDEWKRNDTDYIVLILFRTMLGPTPLQESEKKHPSFSNLYAEPVQDERLWNAGFISANKW